MPDIALGLQNVDGENSLAEFAQRVGASPMWEWLDLGLFDEGVEGWGEAFDQVMTRTIATGCHIHFELNGLDLADALRGDPSQWVGRYTAWELQQIVARQEWFSATYFYVRGRLLDIDQLKDLGIQSPGRTL
jgi:hypothetical protein